MIVTSTKDISLSNFDAWSGGRDTLNDLTAEQCETVERYLEDLYPDGIDETELNDFLWFERDTIAEWLGFKNYDALMKGETADSILDELNGGGYKLSSGIPLEFDQDSFGDFYGYYDDAETGRAIFSSSFEYDGDVDDLAQQIIDDLEE